MHQFGDRVSLGSSAVMALSLFLVNPSAPMTALAGSASGAAGRADAAHRLQPNDDIAGANDPTTLLVEQGLGVAPIEADTLLSALRAHAWREGEVDRLYLDGWVRVAVGDFHFEAQRALVWINRIPYEDAEPDAPAYHEIAVYLEEVSEADRPSGISAEGDELLITASVIGAARLQSDTFAQGPSPAAQEMEPRADARLLAHLDTVALRLAQAQEAATQPEDAVVSGPMVERVVPVNERPIREDVLQPPADGQADAAGEPARGTGAAPPAPAPPQATISFRMDGRLEYAVAEDGSEGTLTLRDNLVIQYNELVVRSGERLPRQLTLTADRAVVFTDPIPPSELQNQQLDASAVHGVYLEGNVAATDGDYTMRGPRMYYEFDTDRAIVLDAVLSTYSEEARVPVYVRAREIRQVARNEWRAEKVRVSTSRFYTPAVSIGAGRVTVTRETDEDTGETHDFLRVGNATVRAAEAPVFWWPGYRGRLEDFPIRSVSVGGNGRNGFTVNTEFDLLGLMGMKKRENADIGLLLDYYAERGPAAGLDVEYRDRDSRGEFFGYVLQDDGEDKLSSGAERDVIDETRSLALWSHMEEFSNDWTVIAEGSYISDERFVDSFFNRWGEERREFQTRLYARQQRDNWQFESFVNYDLNDFIANEDLLQSQGYLVEKVPEVGYYRFADTLFDSRTTWSSEYQLSRMRLSFPRHTLGDIGQGFAGFGLAPNVDLSAAALQAGYTEDYVNRFTTRQEIARPMLWGNVKAVPFLVGRFTGYDDDFDEFSRASEEQRYFGAAGIRFSTQFSRVNNAVESRLFDLHRVRHIVEPSLTFWHGESDADSRDYPIYDLDVEGISTGTAVKAGLRNTWQTQRGGPGRWRSVDVFVVDTDFVFTGGETQNDFDVPRYFDYRPEYSRFGDHFLGDFKWLVSDTLALAGNTIYDLNERAVARSAIGFRIDHSQDLYTYSDLRYMDADDATLWSVGLGYGLSPLYSIRGGTTFDIDREDSQSYNAAIIRRMEQFDVVVGANYDQFREDTTISLTLVPKGAGGQTFGGPLNPRRD